MCNSSSAAAAFDTFDSRHLLIAAVLYSSTLMFDSPLILIPGMGADGRIFRAQHTAFQNLCVPKWITPLRNESLASYARRFAAIINPHQPCYLGGASFGGVVALEMARYLDVRVVFLIGSLRSP